MCICMSSTSCASMLIALQAEAKGLEGEVGMQPKKKRSHVQRLRKRVVRHAVRLRDGATWLEAHPFYTSLQIGLSIFDIITNGLTAIRQVSSRTATLSLTAVRRHSSCKVLPHSWALCRS